SGKTRVLTARIAHLLRERGVAPSRIFAVTFTNKAAGEMRARVAALLGADPRGLWIGTFHALSARLLRREAALLGFGPNFTIYDQDDSHSFIKRLLEQRGHSPKAHPPRAIHAIISGAKNRMVLPEELGASADGPLERVERRHRGKRSPARQDAVHREAGRGAGHAAHRGGRAGRGGVARRRAQPAGGRRRRGVRGDGGSVPHQRPVPAARRGVPVPGDP